MALENGQAPDDRLLVRYLVGSLADEEAERFDELSIADDQFASHLSAVENDLVDAYVKGELSGNTLDLFRSRYLSSPAKREKVRFAEAFLGYQVSATTARAHGAPGWFPWPRSVPLWGLAAATLLVLAAGGYVVVEERRLRGEVTDSRAARAELEERGQQLQRQLDEQRAASAETAKELARVRESLAELEGRIAQLGARTGGARTGILSFTLVAATRGAGEITTIAFSPGTAAVRLQLDLESDDFPAYRAALRDPATDQIIWRGANLHAAPRGDARSLSITIAAKLLKPQTYTVELTGVSERGTAELVSSYPFRVVIR